MDRHLLAHLLFICRDGLLGGRFVDADVLGLHFHGAADCIPVGVCDLASDGDLAMLDGLRCIAFLMGGRVHGIEEFAVHRHGGELLVRLHELDGGQCAHRRCCADSGRVLHVIDGLRRDGLRERGGDEHIVGMKIVVDHIAHRGEH